MNKNYPVKNPAAWLYVWQLAKRLLFVFLLLFLTRIGFYLYNKYFFTSLAWTNWPDILRGGLRFDLAALFYLNGLYLLLALMPFSFVFSRGWQVLLKILFVLTNGLGFLAQLFDFVFFRTTLRRTDFSFFTEFSKAWHLLPVTLRGLWEYLPLFLIWIAVLLTLWYGYGRTTYAKRPAVTLRFFITRLVTLLCTLGLAVIAIRGGTDRTTRPITLSNATAYVSEPLQTALVLNTPFCIIRTVGKPSVERLHFFASEEELEAVYTPIRVKESGSIPGSEEQPASRFGGSLKNVVVLVLESFSRAYTGVLQEENLLSFTPFLDSLAAYSLFCDRAYANGRKSVDAIPSVLGSIPSLEQPFALTPYALNKVEGLGNALKKIGYHTSFFHGAPNGSMGLDGMARHFGFDTYYGMNEFGDKSCYDGYWGIWDEPFLQYVARTLDTFPEPFATAVFTLSSHHPFVLPKEYTGVFPEGPEPIYTCIAYTDYALKRFFERAASSPWYVNTLFVLVADHGAFSRTQPAYATETESMAILLMYHDPSGTWIPQQETYTTYTQQIDIMPTVLEWLDYPYSYFAFGRNIRDDSILPFVINHTSQVRLLREEKEKEPNNELFLKAFRQQYNNRLLDDRLTVTE
ncbi:MAG: LTA synthase family protein [Bacteroidales bacterium]